MSQTSCYADQESEEVTDAVRHTSVFRSRATRRATLFGIQSTCHKRLARSVRIQKACLFKHYFGFTNSMKLFYLERSHT